MLGSWKVSAISRGVFVVGAPAVWVMGGVQDSLWNSIVFVFGATPSSVQGLLLAL